MNKKAFNYSFSMSIYIYIIHIYIFPEIKRTALEVAAVKYFVIEVTIPEI